MSVFYICFIYIYIYVCFCLRTFEGVTPSKRAEALIRLPATLSCGIIGAIRCTHSRRLHIWRNNGYAIEYHTGKCEPLELRIMIYECKYEWLPTENLQCSYGLLWSTEGSPSTSCTDGLCKTSHATLCPRVHSAVGTVCGTALPSSSTYFPVDFLKCRCNGLTFSCRALS